MSLAPLLLALQFADSSFPSGLYTLSHGLEGLVQDGLATSATVEAYLHSTLRHSIAPAEAAAVALAWDAAHRYGSSGDIDGAIGELGAVDARLHATQLCREIREAAVRTGRQMLAMGVDLLDSPLLPAWQAQVAATSAPGTLPVSAGMIYACGGMGREAAVATDLAALVNGYAGAALRLRLVDHVGAQRLVTRASPVIEECVAIAQAAELADLGGFAPVLDVASCRHEVAEARLFGS